MTQGADPGRLRFFTPLFITTAAILLVATVALQPLINAADEYYRKLPVPIRLSLDDFDLKSMPSFRYSPFNTGIPIVAAALGTNDYLMHVFDHTTATEEGLPFGAATLFVTYYPDPDDSIPHTPEVCYRQDGWTVNRFEAVPLDISGYGTVNVSMLHITRETTCLALVYALLSNGELYREREQLRLALALPGDKYTYFCKVESVAYCKDDGFEAALARAKHLLRESIEVLSRDHFPLDEDLKRHENGE